VLITFVLISFWLLDVVDMNVNWVVMYCRWDGENQV
jgi:hypothetical protein